MICLACAEPASGTICGRCAISMTPGREVRMAGVHVRPAFEHAGAARRLVHRLKYEGLVSAARPLAEAMAVLIPDDAPALVPLPRVTLRRWAHGVDPALELTLAMSRVTGMPVMPVLRATPWAARRAGPPGRRRGTPRFRSTGSVPEGAVLIDDVVTTGTTLRAGRSVTGATRAVTATVGIGP